MIKLLGLLNKYHSFKYDENGFLVQSDQIYNDSMIEFNIYIDKNEQEMKTQSPLFFSFRLITKSDTKYVYDISIIEETPSNDNHAYGIVEIYLDNNQITKIIVNDVEDGDLHDKYNDCFDIKPSGYMGVICSKYKYNSKSDEYSDEY